MRPTDIVVEPRHPQIPRHASLSAITRSTPPASVETVFQRAREPRPPSTPDRPCENHLVQAGARLRLLCRAAAGRTASTRPGQTRPGDVLNDVPLLTPSLRFNQAEDSIPGFQARRRFWVGAYADFGGQECTSPSQGSHGHLQARMGCSNGRVAGSRPRVPHTITSAEPACNIVEHGQATSCGVAAICH